MKIGDKVKVVGCGFFDYPSKHHGKEGVIVNILDDEEYDACTMNGNIEVEFINSLGGVFHCYFDDSQLEVIK